MGKTTEFQGISKATLDFLRGLEANNDKAWFDANKKRYLADWLAPAQALVTALGDELRTRVAPGIQAEPRVNGSIMRINRDTRFSADKTPYKTHLDLMFWAGTGRSREQPGLFLRLTAERLWLGVGKHGFAKEELERYRQAVADETRGAALETAIAAALEAVPGATLGGEHYKRIPSGYLDAKHPRAHLLRFDGLHVFLEDAHPDCLASAALVPWCAERLEGLAPVYHWLADTL